MNQEHIPSPGEQQRPPRGQKRKGQSVVHYLAILFAAAFVLLALTYFMERRQNSQALDDLNQSLSGLKESVSAMKSVDELYQENAQLLDQVEQLQEQLARSEQLRDELQNSNASLLASLEETRVAMDWFWQLDEAYARGRYSLCRQLIGHMEEGLVQFLPTVSRTDNGRFSPYDRYQEIYDHVF